MVCLQLRFSGLYGLFGWVHPGMVHRCLTTISCHGVEAVRVVQQLPPSPKA